VTADRAQARPTSLAEVGDSLGDVADVLLEHGVQLGEAVHAFEARYVKAAVARHGGNISQAAAALGVHRNTLRWKLRRNGQQPRGRND